MRKKLSGFQWKLKCTSDFGTLGDGRAMSKAGETFRGVERGRVDLVTFAAVNVGRTGHLSFCRTLEASSMSHSEGDALSIRTQRKVLVPSMVALASPARVQGVTLSGHA